MEDRVNSPGIIELPIEVSAHLDSLAASAQYEPALIDSLANDFLGWADDIREGREPKDCHLLAIRVQQYSQLTAPEHFTAAADYLGMLRERHAPERAARLEAEREKARQNPRFFTINDLPLIAARAAKVALALGNIGSAQTLIKDAVEIVERERRKRFKRLLSPKKKRGDDKPN